MASTERTVLQPRGPKSVAELRKFGYVMAVPLTLIGGFLWWKSSGAAPYLFGLAAAFAVFGLLLPRALAPVERVWMQFAEKLSFIMTGIILTATFFLVITPVGLIRQLLGQETLGVRFDRKLPTYWVPVDPDGPTSRPDKPF